MRFHSYTFQGHRSFGVAVPGDLLIDIPAAVVCLGAAPGLQDVQTLDEALASWDRTLSFAREAVNAAASDRKDAVRPAVRRIAEVRTESPVHHPSKIIGVGLNYADHCREQGIPPPAAPVLFAKLPSAIIGPGEMIRWSAKLTARVDFEAELAVVIGRQAVRVSPGDALQHVAGYTALNDVSARDLQSADRQWVRAKSLDTFCPMGPALVTSDEIGDPNALGIRCSVNGVVLQDSNTGEMIVPVAALIAFISQGITLEPGDVIATGTPHGVGVFRKPPVFLRGGDEVVVWIEKIGDLRNRVVVDDL